MSSKEKSLKESKVSPTPSAKSERDEAQVKINNEKINENLSDEENLSEFDSDSEYEGGQNGEKIFPGFYEEKKNIFMAFFYQINFFNKDCSVNYVTLKNKFRLSPHCDAFYTFFYAKKYNKMAS